MWLYLKQCWKEFSSARNKIWYLLWNQSVCSSVPLPRKTRMTSVYVWPKDSWPAICKDLSRATGLGDLTVLLAQQAPQLVVSLTSKRRQHSAHPCMHILFWEEWLLDLSSYVLSEGSGKSLGMSCSKSRLLILSREANSELCGNTAWSLHSGGWGRWGNAKDHPPVTFPEAQNQCVVLIMLHFISTCGCPGPSVLWAQRDCALVFTSILLCAFMCSSLYALVSQANTPEIKYIGSQIIALKLQKRLGRGNHWNRTISLLF